MSTISLRAREASSRLYQHAFPARDWVDLQAVDVAIGALELCEQHSRRLRSEALATLRQAEEARRIGFRCAVEAVGMALSLRGWTAREVAELRRELLQGVES